MQRSVIAVHKGDAVGIAGKARARSAKRILVAVNGNQSAAVGQAFDDFQRVTAAARRAVYINAVRLDIQLLDALPE